MPVFPSGTTSEQQVCVRVCVCVINGAGQNAAHFFVCFMKALLVLVRGLPLLNNIASFYLLHYSAPLELISSTVGGQVRLHRQQQPDASTSSSCVQTWEEAASIQAAPNVACMVRLLC